MLLCKKRLLHIIMYNKSVQKEHVSAHNEPVIGHRLSVIGHNEVIGRHGTKAASHTRDPGGEQSARVCREGLLDCTSQGFRG